MSLHSAAQPLWWDKLTGDFKAALELLVPAKQSAKQGATWWIGYSNIAPQLLLALGRAGINRDLISI